MKIGLTKIFIDEEIKREIVHILDSGRFIKGPYLLEFEENFAKFIGVKHAIAVNSGSSALLLSLISLKITKMQVVAPSHTFIGTVESSLFLNNPILFHEIERETLLLDVDTVPQCDCVIPVHLYGNAVNIMRLRQKAKYIIEDACQAHGTEFNGKKVGSLGDVGCFSFYPSKGITVAGDGGMVTTNDSAIAESIRQLRDHGRTDHFDSTLVGFNCRMGEIAACIGNNQLNYLKDWIQRRRSIAALYRESLESINIEIPIENPGARHSYQSFVILTPHRDKLKVFLDQAGIETGIHYPIPVHKQKACLRNNSQSLPITELAATQVLSLPISPFHADEEIQFVVKKIKEFYADQK
jgi:dTDP-4-amino-4,6-dideoxygalactose transaminase